MIGRGARRTVRDTVGRPGQGRWAPRRWRGVMAERAPARSRERVQRGARYGRTGRTPLWRIYSAAAGLKIWERIRQVRPLRCITVMYVPLTVRMPALPSTGSR
jgi:hypothetical protein